MVLGFVSGNGFGLKDQELDLQVPALKQVSELLRHLVQSSKLAVEEAYNVLAGRTPALFTVKRDLGKHGDLVVVAEVYRDGLQDLPAFSLDEKNFRRGYLKKVKDLMGETDIHVTSLFSSLGNSLFQGHPVYRKNLVSKLGKAHSDFFNGRIMLAEAMVLSSLAEEEMLLLQLNELQGLYYDLSALPSTVEEHGLLETVQ